MGLATGSGEDLRVAKTLIRLQPRRWQLSEGSRIGLKPGALSRETEAAIPECRAYCYLRVGKGCVTLCAVSQGPWPAHPKPGQLHSPICCPAVWGPQGTSVRRAGDQQGESTSASSPSPLWLPSFPFTPLHASPSPPVLPGLQITGRNSLCC